VHCAQALDQLSARRLADDHRYAVLHADVEILLEPVVGPVDDRVQRVRCNLGAGMSATMILQGHLDHLDPGLEDFGWSRIQTREGSHHTAHNKVR
jgi:hypothetical protein